MINKTEVHSIDGSAIAAFLLNITNGSSNPLPPAGTIAAVTVTARTKRNEIADGKS
jgi:hypothetical protein